MGPERQRVGASGERRSRFAPGYRGFTEDIVGVLLGKASRPVICILNGKRSFRAAIIRVWINV